MTKENTMNNNNKYSDRGTTPFVSTSHFLYDLGGVVSLAFAVLSLCCFILFCFGMFCFVPFSFNIMSFVELCCGVFL